MNENDRTRVLKMLKDGLISVEEAEQLLSAMEGEKTEEIVLKDPRGRKPSKLRIEVDAAGTSQKAKVNVALPISLIRMLGPTVVKNLPAEAREQLDRQGIDLESIIQNIDELLEGNADEDIVNVDTDDGGGDAAKVRIYVV